MYICMFLCFCVLLIYVCLPPVVEYNFCFSVSGVFVLVGGVVVFFFYAWVCVPSFWREVCGSIRGDNAESGCNRRKERTPGQSELMVM